MNAVVQTSFNYVDLQGQSVMSSKQQAKRLLTKRQAISVHNALNHVRKMVKNMNYTVVYQMPQSLEPHNNCFFAGTMSLWSLTFRPMLTSLLQGTFSDFFLS